MSDSPKAGLQRYWGSSRVSSPAPTPTPRDQDDPAGIRAPTSSSASSAYTREESEAAELVLEQLDEQWFCDNVVRWPLSRPGSPPGVIDKDVASPFLRHEFLPSRFSSTTQADVAAGVTKPRPWAAERAPNPHRSRQEIRRLSDGDHHLRRYLERDQVPRRRILEAEDHPRLRHASDSSNSQSSSLPHTPTKLEPVDQSSRFCTDAKTLDGFSPFPSGRLMGVTEDKEMENDLFAKMLANRPAKLTTINPGRLSRGPLQENQNTNTSTSELSTKKPQPRQRRRLKGTKSLTDLEYEELRGLKDLGFEVSKDDLTPHVVRMFPGLQRQGIPPYNSSQGHGESQSQSKSIAGHATQNTRVQSRIPAVQHLLWPRRPDSPLLNAPTLDPSIDMKGQLKSWASEMASIVSIEC